MEKKKEAFARKMNSPVKKIFEESPLPESKVKVESLLIENFVSLQKVMVNLSSKFDTLSSRISKLLDIFEISAKALAEKDFSLEKDTKDTEKILKRVDNLAEQNKIIARGLTLMNDKLSEEPGISSLNKFPPQNQTQKMPPRPIPGQNVIPVGSEFEGYEKSISSTKPEFKKLPKI